MESLQEVVGTLKDSLYNTGKLLCYVIDITPVIFIVHIGNLQ